MSMSVSPSSSSFSASSAFTWYISRLCISKHLLFNLLFWS
jgi:hypothetical protein